MAAFDTSKVVTLRMALAEDAQDDVVATQVDVPIGFKDEASEVQSNQCPKAVDHSQDNCIETHEENDEAQKLPSIISNTTETDKSNDKHEKRSSWSKPKTNQRAEARGILDSLKKVGASSPTPRVLSIKKSTNEQGGDLNGRPSQTSKEVVDTKPGSLTRNNGNASSRLLEAGKLSEAPSSPSKSSLKQPLARKSLSNFTVPQPFALATDKRASLGGQLQSAVKVYASSRSFNSQNMREIEKKCNDGKGGDVKYQEPAKIEATKPQSKTSSNTFNFNSDVRAARRKEFNSKVEERLTAREAEKTQAQAKTKEDIQAEIRHFRKSLTFKATPMPAFYHDATPPKMEIKKIPPTRARSPKLGRRNSITGTHAGQSPADQNAKENSGQMSASKPSSQVQDFKKLSQKTLKQASGLSASSPKTMPNALDSETSSSADKNSACGAENEVVVQIPKSPVLSVYCYGEESHVHPGNGEMEGGQLNIPAVSTG